MSGKFLTNRYEIIEKIGEGGMALVYRATDTLLHRDVAIKVLRPQYASDEQFVERFRREAQAAASLSHPNIVNIYDVGEVDDVYFIVMEYVEGRSLRNIILEEGRLEPARAARYARQICEGLQHAHQHGLIHRDIKPHNILITNDDRVKVTDFGIARAASSSTLTQTGIIIGSVHYFSPEQAKGTNIGPQSDIYSLGVMLFEMLTGKVPFEGDSPIAIALKHIEEELPRVSELRPDCPPALVRIVERATARSLDERYRDAEQMRGDLRRYLWTEEEREKRFGGDEFATQVLPAAELTAARRTQTSGKTAWQRQWRLWVVGGAALLLALAAVSWPFMRNWLNVPEVRVPDVIGRTVSDARTILGDKKLSMEIAGRSYSDRVPVGQIVAQDPLPSRTIKVTRAVRVTVSRGPELVVVPDLTGQDLRQAGITLSQSNLQLGKSAGGYSNDIASGQIMAQDPPPFGRLEKGLSVNVTVSKGAAPNTIMVPNFVGMTYDETVAQISAMGLNIGRVVQEVRPADAFRPGTVLDQNPPPDTSVPPLAAIDLVVAKAPGQADTQLKLPGSGGTSAVRVKKAQVNLVVPSGPQEQVVSIVVIDSTGSHEVFRQVQAPGDRVLRTVQGTGDRIRVRVYVDGTLLKDETVE